MIITAKEYGNAKSLKKITQLLLFTFKNKTIQNKIQSTKMLILDGKKQHYLVLRKLFVFL